MQNSEGGPWLRALFATLLIQTCSSFLSRIIPTLGPPITELAGISESAIGYMAAVGTVGSILFLFGGTPVIFRHGPVRSLQLGLLLAAIGCLLILIPTWPALLLSAFLVGIGYGPSAPAGSDVLQRYAPARHRTLLFSIKQAGVPIGGAMAGVALPATYGWGGIQAVAMLALAVTLAVVLIVQPMRSQIDDTRDRFQKTNFATIFSVDNFIRPLALISTEPALRQFGLSGAFLAIGQGCWFAFLVTFLAQNLGLTLPTAGLVFATMQAAGVVGRIAMGWVADRIGSGRHVLQAASVTSAICSIALAMAQPAWPAWSLFLLAGCAGLTVSSWNGVQLSEIARRAPPGKVSESSSGATILVFLGYVIGPSGFAILLQLTGSFQLCFLVVGVLTGFTSLILSRLDDRPSRSVPKP